ncbi:MAG: sensor histidine kinase [Candidatus Deferrimicrobiaceae bacterium]
MQYETVKGKTLDQLLGGWKSRLLQSPVAVLSALVLTIFTAEAAIMGLLHLIPSLPRWLESWLDSSLLIIVLYPWLIFLVKRPFLFHIKEREHLEQRVEERTSELVKANRELRQMVAAHKRAEEELKSSREQLRNLSARLQSLMEEERARISREIHDELGQSLTALKFDLSSVGSRMGPDQTLLVEKTKSMMKLVDSTINTVRKISRELRPGLLDDLGLAAAIAWQAKEFRIRTGIPCKVFIAPEDMAVDPERSTAIFRILQEALTNIVRYAGATNVEVTLEDRDGLLRLEVKDDGRGITKEQISGSKSLGLIGIRERVLQLGGKVLIDGSPNAGTVVWVAIPTPGARVDNPSMETREDVLSTSSMVTTT